MSASTSEAIIKQMKSLSQQWERYRIFAVVVVLALLIIIIFECISIVLMVTKVKDGTEVVNTSDTECAEDNQTPLCKFDGRRLNISEVMQRNCRDIQEKIPGAVSGLYLIRVGEYPIVINLMDKIL